MTVSGLPGEARLIGPREQSILEIIRTSELLARVGNNCVFSGHLSQAKFNILIILKYYGSDGLSQKEILERMVSTKGNLSIHIKMLAADGYVSKRTSRNDRRHDIITLTARGKRLLATIEPEYLRHVEDLTECFSDNDAAGLLAILKDLQERCLQLLGAEATVMETPQ